MASSHIAIEFRSPGPQAFAEHIRTIDAVPATEIIYHHSRELPWYERDELFGQELGCRVVIWIHEALDETEVEGAPEGLDPYRKDESFDIEYQIPPQLAEVIAALDGACSIVERGRLSFTTRRYEAAVRDQLCVDLEAAARKLARCQFGVERERLVGRIEGTIAKIHELEGLVRRSGLVDADALRLDYV